MRTMIQGKEAAWSPKIRALFVKKRLRSLDLAAVLNDENLNFRFVVTDANYFEPRPFVDIYNRGSDTYGFTYTVNGRYVYQTTWRQDA